MESRCTVLTGVEMIKFLNKRGFMEFKVKGSHYHFKVNGITFQVPYHHKELGKGIVNSIYKIAKIER